MLFLVEMSSQHFLLIIYTIRCYQRRVVVGDLDDIIIRVGPHITHSGLEFFLKVQKKIREKTWISRLFFFGTRFITNFKGNKNLRHISFGWILVKMSIDFLFYFMFLLLPFLLAFTSPLCTHTIHLRKIFLSTTIIVIISAISRRRKNFCPNHRRVDELF